MIIESWNDTPPGGALKEGRQEASPSPSSRMKTSSSRPFPSGESTSHATDTRQTPSPPQRTETSTSTSWRGQVIRVRTCEPGSRSRLELGFRKRVIVDCRPVGSRRLTLMCLSQSGW